MPVPGLPLAQVYSGQQKFVSEVLLCTSANAIKDRKAAGLAQIRALLTFFGNICQ